MSKCKHKMGLLILRECGRETEVRCQNCGKPICQEHTTDHGNYMVCYDCKSAPMNDTSGADSYAKQAYTRNHYYHAVGYMPLYSRRYHDHDYDNDRYDDYDYDTFEGDESALMYDDFGDDMNENDFSDS